MFRFISHLGLCGFCTPAEDQQLRQLQRTNSRLCSNKVETYPISHVTNEAVTRAVEANYGIEQYPDFYGKFIKLQIDHIDNEGKFISLSERSYMLQREITDLLHQDKSITQLAIVYELNHSYPWPKAEPISIKLLKLAKTDFSQQFGAMPGILESFQKILSPDSLEKILLLPIHTNLPDAKEQLAHPFKVLQSELKLIRNFIDQDKGHRIIFLATRVRALALGSNKMSADFADTIYYKSLLSLFNQKIQLTQVNNSFHFDFNQPETFLGFIMLFINLNEATLLNSYKLAEIKNFKTVSIKLTPMQTNVNTFLAENFIISVQGRLSKLKTPAAYRNLLFSPHITSAPDFKLNKMAFAPISCWNLDKSGRIAFDEFIELFSEEQLELLRLILFWLASSPHLHTFNNMNLHFNDQQRLEITIEKLNFFELVNHIPNWWSNLIKDKDNLPQYLWKTFKDNYCCHSLPKKVSTILEQFIIKESYEIGNTLIPDHIVNLTAYYVEFQSKKTILSAMLLEQVKNLAKIDKKILFIALGILAGGEFFGGKNIFYKVKMLSVGRNHPLLLHLMQQINALYQLFPGEDNNYLTSCASEWARDQIDQKLQTYFGNQHNYLSNNRANLRFPT